MLTGPSGANGAPNASLEGQGRSRFNSIDKAVPFYSQYNTLPQSQPRSNHMSIHNQAIAMGTPSQSNQMYNQGVFHMGAMANSLQVQIPHQYQPSQFYPNAYAVLPPAMPYATQYQATANQQHMYQGGPSFQGYPGYHTVPYQQASQAYSSTGYGVHPSQSAYSFLDHTNGPSSHYSERALGGYNSEVSSNNPSQQLFGSLQRLETNTSSVDTGEVPSVPRGPPRKPRQSGYALWVGNLPLGARVIDLKDYFSRDATNDIESLKLISKSNCAFVNYRSQDACAAAMARFHDSRFHGTRLVCRLRRSSTTNTAAISADVSPTANSPETPVHPPDCNVSKENILETVEAPTTTRVATKYFVLKSLTLQDLEMSTRTGLWSTQAHNEESLSQAYKTADEVFLVFSANKSGEYFGYARMKSPVLSGASVEIAAVVRQPVNVGSSTHGVQSHLDPGPKSIPTPATEWAPRGRIIDDSARGTIFWEADFERADAEEKEADSIDPEPANTAPLSSKPVIARSTAVPNGESRPGQDSLKGSSTNSFRVEWLSTRKVPFYRTRGLRNPWNADREIKIARDGTELEPVVGKKLLGLFGGLPSNVHIPTAQGQQ